MKFAIEHQPPSSSPELGATADDGGVHFSVWAAEAERVDLCLFDDSGQHEQQRLSLPECVDGIWSGYLPDAQPGLRYGYRAYGPYDPSEGLRFNHHKLLLDPYAKKLAGELHWNDALYGYRIGSARADLSFDSRDSAKFIPKAVVTREDFDWEDDQPPRVPWSDSVIYEMHVRGFSKQLQDIPEQQRGTFSVLGHPASIAHLRQLGVTAVELLPVHAFVRDRHLLERGLTNYWGYNTLAYFAPEPAYLSTGNSAEMKWAIQQLHHAGIEVILDVVYNHTCEGSELGPTLSWRGLHNRGYYRLLEEDPRFHVNDSGCGNTLDPTCRRVIQMIMDSLRYWVREFHIDGFRFDLGVALGRESYGFDPNSGFFDALLQDPTLADVKLISEPWDLGPGGFQLGNHPARFREWNSHFRDDVRRYWRGDDGLRGALAQRLQGSANEFRHNWRRPSSSINFLAAHDGFTLCDLVSYNDKHNDDNGEENNDGCDNNLSHNWGFEGSTDDATILAQREKMMRNLLTTLFVSAGTPMLLAGDEFGQTQAGNNNAYCQDGPLSWLDWARASTKAGHIQRDFTARLIALRKEYSRLRLDVFHDSDDEVAPGVLTTLWFDERGVELQEEDWNNPMARVFGVRRAAAIADGQLTVMTLLFNADSNDHTFKLPDACPHYRLVLRTDQPQTQESAVTDGSTTVPAHSLQILVADACASDIAAERSSP